jgi:hypothetical protein
MNLLFYLFILTSNVIVFSQSSKGSMNYQNSFVKSVGLVKNNAGSAYYGHSSKHGSLAYGHSGINHGSTVHGSSRHEYTRHGSTAYVHSVSKHGSTRHGSTAYVHSGSKHGSTRHGSTRHGSTTHGSGLHKNSGSKHGSGTKGHSGSNAKGHGGSTAHGSGAKGNHIFSAYVFSGAKYGSSRHGSSRHESNPHTSVTYKHSNHKGCGIHGSTKYIHSGPSKYGSGTSAFSPTLEPTESLPEVYSPPQPTFNPTESMKINIPNIQSVRNNPDTHIPPLPLSFQINQGADGWSSYPDSPPNTKILTTVVSKIIKLEASSITNMKIHSDKIFNRVLYIYPTRIRFSYNITTTPIKIINNIPNELYYNITFRLKSAILDNTFNEELHNLGLNINITSIQISKYSLVYPESTSIDSTPKNDVTENNKFYITLGSIVLFGILTATTFLIYTNRKTSTDKNFIDDIPNPLQRQTTIE